jgi:hypothetical protein
MPLNICLLAEDKEGADLSSGLWGSEVSQSIKRLRDCGILKIWPRDNSYLFQNPTCLDSVKIFFYLCSVYIQEEPDGATSREQTFGFGL